MPGVADRLLLDVENKRRLGTDISKAIVSVERTGSMEERPALAIVVDDPHERLWRSETLTEPKVRKLGTPAGATLRTIDLRVDDVWYRLEEAGREGLTTTLQFAHRGTVLLESLDDAMTGSRAKTARAQFIRRQVDQVAKRFGRDQALAFWAYAPGRRMPVAHATTSRRTEPDRNPARNVEKGRVNASLTIGGRATDAAQRRNIALALGMAEQLKAGPKATLALAEACIVEAPNFTNPTGGDSTSAGILQLLNTHLGGSLSENGGRRDVALVCKIFLQSGFTGKGGAIDIAARNPGMSAGIVAAEVQGPREDLRGRYDQVKDDAQRVIAAYGGGSSSATATEAAGTYAKPYQFKRPDGKGGWTSTGELAEEVGNRRFVTIPAPGSDLFVYGADIDLLRLAPQAIIRPDASYVTESFTPTALRRGGLVTEATVTVRANAFDQDFAWGIPVDVRDAGPATELYLVWDVREVDGSPDVELTLHMPQKAKPEPAAETVTTTSSSSSYSTSGTRDVSSGSVPDRVYARALAISQQNLPYQWGGGHGRAGVPTVGDGRGGATPGYDCSAYVSACLEAGGLMPGHTSLTSTGFYTWGKPGKGKYLTVWANESHAFLEMDLPGRKYKSADTSRESGGPAGPHVRTGLHSTGGFTPRHPEGF